MFKLLAIAGVALTGCVAAPHAPTPALSELSPSFSHADPSDDCAPGRVIISIHDEPSCDLVGGQNTLTLTDISPADCDLYGGTFDGDDGCDDVDF